VGRACRRVWANKTCASVGNTQTRAYGGSSPHLGVCVFVIQMPSSVQTALALSMNYICMHVNRIRDPANPFPVFRNHDAIDKEEWIREATGEMMRSGMAPGYSMANTVRHYDNTKERRAHGVGFYAFSHDEDERQRQMRELQEIRSQVRRRMHLILTIEFSHFL